MRPGMEPESTASTAIMREMQVLLAEGDGLLKKLRR